MSSPTTPISSPVASPFATPDAVVPPSSSFTAAWVAYSFFIAGIFLWWPALFGLIVCYSKRGDANVLATHHRWLIRTFWWALLAYLAGFGVLLASIWPLIARTKSTLTQTGGQWNTEHSLNVGGAALLAPVGATLVGLGIILCAWLWFIYRIVRGGNRLANAQPAP